MQGRVAGINSSRFGRGQGLTIPSASVARIVETLVRQGRIRRAYLGIGSQVVRLPAGLAAKVDGRETALLVVSVDEESPAGAAGLLVGDLLTGIEGEPVRDTEDLQRALGPERVGVSVTLDVLSGGEPVQRTATLAERA
nr:serine protease [uncultured bacterium]